MMVMNVKENRSFFPNLEFYSPNNKDTDQPEMTSLMYLLLEMCHTTVLTQILFNNKKTSKYFGYVLLQL